MGEVPLPFIDLDAQRHRLGGRIDHAIARVVDHGRFIMGPEVVELEERLADHCGAAHVVTCASGTDALLLALMALKVESGDAVVVPSFTFAATAEMVALIGATPVFADVEPSTFNLDPRSATEAVAVAEEAGLRPVGIIAVDLFGQPADYASLHRVAEENGMWVVADAAQSYGAKRDGRRVGTLASTTTTSFFPAKPLGCYGDGGAIFTESTDTAALLRSLRVHGQGADKYDNVRIGTNGRLDTIQAAVLLAKLEIFDEELERRQAIADRYSDGLRDVVDVPLLSGAATSAWAQYTIRIQNRDRVRLLLHEKGIPTGIYYSRPLHQQPAYEHYLRDGKLPVSSQLPQSVLSIPMHPYLDGPTQQWVIDCLRDALR